MQDCQAPQTYLTINYQAPQTHITINLGAKLLENMYFSNSYTGNTRALSAGDIRFPMLCSTGTCTGGAPDKLLVGYLQM